MSKQISKAESPWSTEAVDAHAALRAARGSMDVRMAELEDGVRDLRARLHVDPTGSPKQCPTGPIGLKRKPLTPPSWRKRGGQPSHQEAFRARVPPENPRSSRDCRPCDCRLCGCAPDGRAPNPLIHQVADLLEIAPPFDEYRRRRPRRSGSGATACVTPPEDVRAGRFGPHDRVERATRGCLQARQVAG